MYKLPGKFRTSKITSTASYQENQPLNIDLITARDVTFLKGTLKMNSTIGTASPTAVEDGVAKLVQDISLYYNGSNRPIRALSLQQLVLYGQHLLNGRLRNDQPPTAAGTQDNYVDFIISPSLDVVDPQNPAFCIPGEAPGVNNLKISGQWGNPANVWSGGTNGTINSATLTINEEAGWTLGPDQDVLRGALGVDPNGYVYMPLWLATSEAHTGAYTGLGLGIKFPTDVIVRRAFFIVKDANGNRSDSIVSEFAVRTSDNDDLFGALDFQTAQRVMAMRLDMDPITGCLLINCTEDIRDPGYANRKAGLEVNKADKLYFKYSTTAAGSIDVLWDCIKRAKVF